MCHLPHPIPALLTKLRWHARRSSREERSPIADRASTGPVSSLKPPRCAILPPVPVPYREPLFERLAERGRLAIRVIYQAGLGAGWDQRADWFPERHAYPAAALRAWQRPR